MRRTFEIHCPDGTVHRPVLESGRWYGLDGLPWHAIRTLSSLAEQTAADTLADCGGWRVVEIVEEPW